MPPPSPNCVVVLGPTASGKTALAVRLAHAFGGEVVSADSRQVYRALDIGSGKDLDEYILDGSPVSYHLIDIVNLDQEFSVFHYQQRFYETFEALQQSGILPIVCGGTGLYLEAVLSNYRMVDVPENSALREALAALSDEALADRLRTAKPDQHNVTNLDDRARTIRAIEIAEYSRERPPPPAPPLDALVLGVRWERPALHRRIETRLKGRLDAGLIEEVSELLKAGVASERLHTLGLEYRFVTEFIEGKIKNKNDLHQKLAAAIRSFAKRQDTWFRRMERNGVHIHWIDQGNYKEAHEYVAEALGVGHRRDA